MLELRTHTARSLSTSRVSNRLSRLRDESKKNRETQRMHEMMNESLNETIRGFEKIWSGSKFEPHERAEKEEEARAGPGEKRAAGYRKILDSIDESLPQGAQQPRAKLQFVGAHRQSSSKLGAAALGDRFACESSEKQPAPVIALHLDSKSSKSHSKHEPASFRPPLVSISSPKRLFPVDREGSVAVKQGLFQSRNNSKERSSTGVSKGRPADRPTAHLPARDKEASESTSNLMVQAAGRPHWQQSSTGAQQLAAVALRPSRHSKENRRPSQSHRENKQPGPRQPSSSRQAGLAGRQLFHNQSSLHLQTDSPKKQAPASSHFGAVTSKLDRFSRQVGKLSSNFDVVVLAIGGKGSQLTREFEADVKLRMNEIESLVQAYLRKLDEGQEAIS